MKLAALARLLTERGRCKVFVTTAEFCLCGQLGNLRRAGEAWLVEGGAAVRVLRSGELLEERFRSGSLLLDDQSQLTRRLQTHRRHVAGREVPDAYWQKAAVL